MLTNSVSRSMGDFNVARNLDPLPPTSPGQLNPSCRDSQQRLVNSNFNISQHITYNINSCLWPSFGGPPDDGVLNHFFLFLCFS